MYVKPAIFFIISFFIAQNLVSQTQTGSTINGENDGDMFGRDVSLSSDGTVMAVGAIDNDGGGNNVGHVRVYKYSDGSWTQLGTDIDTSGSNNSDGINGDFGHSVALSSDGTILAVGDRYYTPDNGQTSKAENNHWGLVRVFQYSDNSWSQIGPDIVGISAQGNFGFEVSLSSDGTIVASGDINNNENSGSVRVFKYSNNSWSQLGSSINGFDNLDKFGYSLDLSSDGAIIAAGSPYHNSNTGVVMVFQYSNESWSQLGEDIDGEAGGDQSGTKVRLNSDGTILAVGAPYNTESDLTETTRVGHVRVFQYSNEFLWVQKGSDIDGENLQDEFGRGIGMSDNGNVIAIGGTQYHSDENGIVNIYNWNGSDWEKFGNSILAENIDTGSTNFFGEEVSLSSNGTIVASGAKAGNYAKIYSLAIDQEGPTMTITSAEVSDGETSNNNTLSLTFTSNEDTSDFAEDDITVVGGTLSNFSSTSSTEYTATFTPSEDGDSTIDVAENTFTDAMGNGNSAASQFNWTFDSTGPSITISASEVSDGDTSNDNTLSLIFTSNEDTSDFTEDDITIAGGTLSNFSSTSSKIYTATFTPSEDGDSTIDVAENTFTDAFGNNNSAASQFNWTYDSTGPSMVISSTSSSSSSTISTVAGGNGQGSALNQINYAGGIFIDSSNNVFIADTKNHRIVKWEPGATEGIVVAGGNGQGDALNQLYEPEDVYIDSTGNMIISDGKNNRVLKWEPGASEGVVVAGGNGQGDSLNQFFIADGIDFDSSGNLYVADQNNSRVMKWEPGASEGIVVAGGNGLGDALNQLHAPTSVAVDSNGNVYVSSSNNKRVTKWASGANEGVVFASGDLEYMTFF